MIQLSPSLVNDFWTWQLARLNKNCHLSEILTWRGLNNSNTSKRYSLVFSIFYICLPTINTWIYILLTIYQKFSCISIYYLQSYRPVNMKYIIMSCKLVIGGRGRKRKEHREDLLLGSYIIYINVFFEIPFLGFFIALKNVYQTWYHHASTQFKCPKLPGRKKKP